MLNQGSQQIDASLDILVGLSFQELLDGNEQFLAIQTHPGQTTEDISNIPAHLPILVALEQSEEGLDQIRLQHCLGILVVHEQIAKGSSEGSETLKSEYVFWRVGSVEVGVNCFQNEGVLIEQKGGLGVNAEEQQGIDGEDLFLS